MSSMATSIESWLTRSRTGAALIYAASVTLFLFVIVTCAADLVARRDAVGSATDLLAQLEGRRPTPGTSALSSQVATGSPFLEGTTVTVAGAALLQRVATAVGKVGGNILSSQVEVQQSAAKPGFVSLLASVEVEQRGLQPLVYDIEAGMPFLFVDQLVVQAPGSSGEIGGKLRVLLGVSGQWQGTK